MSSPAALRRPVVSVIGAAGGCGASTVAGGLALAWAVEGDGAPWLVELDAARADLAARWDLPGERTIADLDAVVHEIEPDHLARAAVPHHSGAVVLLGPPRAVDGVAPEVVDGVLASVDRLAPVVLDLAAGTDRGSRRALLRSSIALIVCPATAHGALRARRAVEGLVDPPPRLTLVAAPSEADSLSSRGLSRAVGLDVAAVLPRATRDAESIRSGRWPGVRRRGLGRQLLALAGELAR